MVDQAWRDPAQITSQWQDAAGVDPKLLRQRVSGGWWDLLAQLGCALLVTREYEHLVLALRCDERGPRVTFMPLPHPSGLAVDRARGAVYLASTRNPNQLFELRPDATSGQLIAVSSHTFPGRLYLHDVAFVDGQLHGAAAGLNAIVRLDGASYEPAWWPACVETDIGPRLDRNFLQLNSIAAGDSLEQSFFSASADRLSARRPGHRNFPVDGRGVIFGGATREPVCRGLTRPHSARLHAGELWVDNSGYGELSRVEEGRARPFLRLPGWTRGLCFHQDIAFVGTSRVLPRFEGYAPGLEPRQATCGVHAVHLPTGRILGSITWPDGNQIFGLDWLPSSVASGFPFRAGKRGARERAIFYSFSVEPAHER